MGNKEYFDEVAKQWDKMREGFFSEAVREKALAIAGVQAGKLAADIGAGTGFITEGLIQKGIKVIAIDRSEAMLTEMRRKFSSIDGIEYRKGEAKELPIPNETVDYVFANMYLHHVESPQKAIKEMVRILKPGGMLVITDLDEHNFDFLREEHHDRWMGFKRDDVKGWLTEAGLENIGADCVDEDCCAQSNCGGGHARVSIFIASGEKLSPAIGR
jgi:ubiquinone/menaquinone biosynthesis C-methylase UbiE